MSTDTGYRSELLNHCIAEFRDQRLPGDPGRRRMEISELRDPKISEGCCLIIAAVFSDFLNRHQLPADLGLPGHTLFGEMHPDVWGYQDRQIEGRRSHSATTLLTEGQTLMIDWTCSQYGYAQFPMVQRLEDRAEPLCWERLSGP